MITTMGQTVINFVIYFFQMLLTAYHSIRATFKDQSQGSRTILSVVSSQIYFTGWQALPFVGVLASAAGVLVALQFKTQLAYFGHAQYIGDMLVVVVVREIAPLLTALLVTARSGTAVVSELASMKVNREIEALESMGIDPLSYIIFPRLIGGVVSIFCLSVFFNVVCVLFTFLILQFSMEFPFQYFAQAVANAFSTADLFFFLFKIILSGFIIFIICCHEGLQLKQSPHEIPQVTMSGVVKSLIYVCFTHFITSGLFYLDHFVRLGVL